MDRPSFLRLFSAAGVVVRATRRFFATQPPGRLFALAAGLLAIGLIFGFAVTVIANVLLFDGYAANGAFQLMNPLRRLAAGEVIGRDFNFFHGVGVPLVHLPFYYLFGQGLFGSEVARWLVSPGIFMLTTFIFFYVLRRGWRFALVATVLVVGVAMVIMPFLVLPLTSLLGVRSAVPVLLLALMLCQTRLRRPLTTRLKYLTLWTWYEVLAGLLLALSVICGTEFGLAAVIAFFIAHIAYQNDVRRQIKTRLASAVRVAVAFIVWLLGVLAVIAHGSPLQSLKFALSEIPADQFWYFGVPPNNFLHAGNLLETFATDGRVLAMWVVALVASWLVWRVHRIGTRRVHVQAFVFGLLAGVFSMVSMLGYYHNSEASALARMSLLVGMASLVLMWGEWKKPLPVRIELGKRKKHWDIGRSQLLRMAGYAAIVVAIVYNGAVLWMVRDEYDVRRVARVAKQFVLGETTNILGPTWHGVDEAVIPVIQADNTIAIADVNDGEFSHGVNGSKPQVWLERDAHAGFVRPGQLVYFVKAGRQIISAVEPRGGRLLVTFEQKDLRLDPAHDGAPAKLIIAEDFAHNSNKLWSLYSGVLESEMGIKHPSRQGYDYIIHALGEERRTEYVNEFKRVQPQFVLTLSRPYFRYEEWVQNAHWDFYSLLDQNYEVVKETQIYVVWKKREQKWTDRHAQTQPWRQLDIDRARQKIMLPNLSFADVPDIAQYDQQKMREEQDRLKNLGKETESVNLLSPEEFDRYRVDEERAKRNQELTERESRGFETDAREHQLWLKEVEAGRLDKEGLAKPKKTLMLAERPKRQVVLVKLRYSLRHPLAGLPILGKTNRFFVEANNVYSSTPVSLRPYAHEVVFPVVISEKNSAPYLQMATYSLLPGKGEIDISSAEWTILDTSTANLKALTDSM